MKNFNSLPISEQEKIKGMLKAYDEVDVFFENGKYQYGVVLKKQYASDHEYIGTFKASDIYTEQERIENYINEFYEYPISYKGKRDYTLLKKMQDRTFNNDYTTMTHWQGKIIDGDFQLTEKVTIKI